MHMLNHYCGVDRDSRGVVRLTICNAGSLNILGSTVINGVREGLEVLATERRIRVLVIAGQGGMAPLSLSLSAKKKKKKKISFMAETSSSSIPTCSNETRPT